MRRATTLAPEISLPSLKKPGQALLTSFSDKIAAQLPGFFTGKQRLAALR
jgi:hypothetical protein